MNHPIGTRLIYKENHSLQWINIDGRNTYRCISGSGSFGVGSIYPWEGRDDGSTWIIIPVKEDLFDTLYRKMTG